MQKTPHARLGARDVSHDPDRRTGGAPRDGRLAPARLGAFFAPMTRTLTPTFKRDRASRRADRPRASDPDDANAIRESSSTRRVDATTPRRVPLPGTPTSGVERAGAPRHRVSSSPAPPPGSAPPPAVASERWVTRFLAFKCVHLDPMADERAAQLSARVRAQTASIAKVKHHLSTYDANGATASDGPFRPKPSKSTRRVDNVTAFLAAVAEKKFIAKKERRARRRSRLSTVSDDEEGAASARARGPNARPLVSRRDARAPSPSPPASGDEDGGTRRVGAAAGAEAKRNAAPPESSRRAPRYASGAVPSAEALGDVVARVRSLRAGGKPRSEGAALQGLLRIENAEQREATAEDALGGALEAYHGSLSFEPKGFDAKRVAGRVAGDS